MFKHQGLQLFDLKLKKYEYFYPLEVVSHGSETQLEVGGQLTYLI